MPPLAYTFNELIAIEIRANENKKKDLSEGDTRKVQKFLKKNWKDVVEKWTKIVVLQTRITIKRIAGL